MFVVHFLSVCFQARAIDWSHYIGVTTLTIPSETDELMAYISSNTQTTEAQIHAGLTKCLSGGDSMKVVYQQWLRLPSSTSGCKQHPAVPLGVRSLLLMGERRSRLSPFSTAGISCARGATGVRLQLATARISKINSLCLFCCWMRDNM